MYVFKGKIKVKQLIFYIFIKYLSFFKKEWNNLECKNVQTENEDGKIFSECKCKKLNPTTVVADVENIF